MAVMSRKEESLADKLVAFAGDPAIVEEALLALSNNDEPPSIKELLVQILEIRAKRGLGEPLTWESAQPEFR